MRILYHHRTLADGAEGIHIAEMVEAFRSLGHDVHVKGLNASPDRDHPTGFVHAIRRTLPETLVQATSLVHNVADFLETSREIRRFRPDLLYKRHARYDVAALEAAKRRCVPIVLEVNAVYSAKPYSDFEPLLFHPMAERLECQAFALASAIIAVSTPLARQVERLAHRQVTVLPNGANPQRFDVRRANPARVRAQHRLDTRLIVGWTGILRRWHGLDILLDALTALPDAMLLVIGDGPERAAIEQRAVATGVRDRLVVTGRMPHSEMPDYLAAMDIAVVSDERTGVASPMKLLEYMAMSRAVVAPRLDNIADLIDDEANGLLFDDTHAASLAQVLRRLAADPELRLRLGSNARQKIEQQLSWRKNAEVVVALENFKPPG